MDPVISSTMIPSILTRVDLLLLLGCIIGSTGVIAKPHKVQRQQRIPMAMKTYLHPTELSRSSCAGARRNVPTPVPHTQIPVARDLLLLKCSATATTEEMYIRPNPSPVMTL